MDWLTDLVSSKRPIRWQPPSGSFRLNIARVSQQGKRAYQEDKVAVTHSPSYCCGCVCDGHYGPRAARYAAKHLPTAALKVCGAAAPQTNFLRSLMEHRTITIIDGREGRSSAINTSSIRTSINEPESPQVNDPDSLPSLLSRVYRDVDAAWLGHAAARTPELNDGTTATMLLVDARAGLATVACAGDSRAVAAVNGGAVVLTVEHNGSKNESERKRILALGGELGLTGRVRGKLMVTRALGDLPYKRGKCEVICEPEVRTIRCDESLHFVIVASDGLWDVFSSDEAVRFVQRGLIEAKGDMNRRTDRVGRDLAQAALDRGSEDNISVLLFVFEHLKPGTLEVIPPPPERPEQDDAGSDDESRMASRTRSRGGHRNSILPSGQSAQVLTPPPSEAAAAPAAEAPVELS